MISVLPRGMTHFRSVLSRAATGGRSDGAAYAAEKYGASVARVTKEAIDAGGLASGSWTAALSSPESAEFWGAVAQASVVGRLGLRPVALNIRTIALVERAMAYWVGNAGMKPLSRMALDGDILEPLKIAVVYVLTQESARFADAATEQGMRADAVRILAEAIDATLLNPLNAGVAGESPASVTYGATAIPSSGSAAADIPALIEAFDGDLAAALFVGDPLLGAQIGLARDLGGSPLYPDAGVRGGQILGVPFITSRASPRDSSGAQLALIDGGGIAFGAAGVRAVVSGEATLAMRDDPASPAEQVSLWQCNCVAVLNEIVTNWRVVRPGSVAYVADADYSVGVS